MALNDLNFKKGWIFRLDDDEEWRKYWFVLTDSSFKYYRDAQAEERDELEGELDLRLCTDIIEYDVEKNYGFQLHTRESIITLSAMTSKIRRNWIDILRRNISGNPSDKYRGSKAGPPGTNQDEPTAPLTNRREAGVGRDQEHERRLEDRTRWFQEGIVCTTDGSRWDTIELKKGTIKPTERTAADLERLAESISGGSQDIDKKWEDFERMQMGEAQSLAVVDSSKQEQTKAETALPPTSPTRQHREVRFGEPPQKESSTNTNTNTNTSSSGGSTSVGGPCGPNAPCGPRMRALEKLYKETLEATQREHERQMERLQRETERLLMEEAQAAAKTIDALKRAHLEELEKTRSLTGGDCRKPTSEAMGVQEELNGLSERYSEKCVELERLQHLSQERHAEARRAEEDIQLMRRDNQELQSRVTEEMTLMRTHVTGGQESQSQRSPEDIEVLLRAKENEIAFMQKEIACLRNEVAALVKEKESMCERFKEVYVELSRVKGISEREMDCLREHLSLASAALQEQQLMAGST
ncbi:TRIO and F-actin-binding protein [Engraulis encrasicolus]|uniref:TRIO and F-actin-binding protein n=1 Tax=Engraulis encrasicolus TaxID=184585 RepID=UPI002FD33E6B